MAKNYTWVKEKDYNSIRSDNWPDFTEFQMMEKIPYLVSLGIDNLLQEEKTFDHPSFCVEAFYTSDVANDHICCLWPKNVDLSSIRSQMLAGKKPIECSHCWAYEEKGIKSDRQLNNRSLDYWSGIDLETWYNNALEGKHSPVVYRIGTNNVCNATCATCDYTKSTGWGLLEKQNGLIASDREVYKWQVKDSTLKKIDFDNAKFIQFAGGESLLANTNFDILQQMLEHGNNSCFIAFVTNGSIRPTKRQQKILDEFQNVNFGFSIDGTEKVFEYTRFPLKWKTILENIKWAKDQNYIVSSCYTLSNINILDHWNTLNWFEQNDIECLINPVYEPSIFSPGNINDAMRNQLASIRQDNTLDIWIEKEYDSDMFEKFKQELARQDQLKKISVRNYIGNLYNCLN